MEAEKSFVDGLQDTRALLMLNLDKTAAPRCMHKRDHHAWDSERVQNLTEKKLSKKVRNHQVIYTVMTMGKSTAHPPKNLLETQLDSTECNACTACSIRSSIDLYSS